MHFSDQQITNSIVPQRLLAVQGPIGTHKMRQQGTCTGKGAEQKLKKWSGCFTPLPLSPKPTLPVGCSLQQFPQPRLWAALTLQQRAGLGALLRLWGFWGVGSCLKTSPGQTRKRPPVPANSAGTDHPTDHPTRTAIDHKPCVPVLEHYNILAHGGREGRGGRVKARE